MTSARHFDPRGLKYSAIAIGIVVDIGATVAVALGLFVVAFLVRVARSETPVEDDRLVQLLFAPALLTVGATLCSILGGFVAGLVAKRDELRHGFFAGVGGFVLSLPLFLIPDDGRSAFWAPPVATFLVIPAYAAGSWLAARRRKRAQAVTPP